MRIDFKLPKGEDLIIKLNISCDGKSVEYELPDYVKDIDIHLSKEN